MTETVKKTWQDKVFLFGGLILAATLIPVILSPVARVPLSSSLLTGGILGLYTLAFYSLKMRLSAFSMGLSSAGWLLIAALRH